MMTLNKIPFKEVNGAGLFVDTVYEGGSDKNISSEVISKLLHVGNSGGFRKCMKVEGGKKTKAAAYVCIYTTGEELEWRDELDRTLGRFIYGATTEKQEIHLRRPNSAEMISSKIFFQSLLLG